MPTKRLLVLLALTVLPNAGASESVYPVEPSLTLRHLLSGRSPEDAVTWQFAKGLFAETPEQATAATWSTITVPSNWELEPAVSPSDNPSSQGSYSYGRGVDRKDKSRKKQLADTGTYRHRFEVPEQLLGTNRRFLLRFEGVMTDARVFLNSQLLTTKQGQQEHVGGFVPFSYDVTATLHRDRPNELIVAVREESSNPSVNRAERDADYWLFGGIFRPVTLLSLPARFIETVAVDAKADGSLRVRATMGSGSPGSTQERFASSPATVQLSLRDPRTGQVLAESSAVVAQGTARFDLLVRDILPWSAQSPTLYRLELLLPSVEGTPGHQTGVNVGFRTLEVRVAPSRKLAQDPDSAGLFVNGERTILRGINRHSFWPETGRALSTERNRKDVELIKELGFNAVRSSHYPPDQAFLDACDELGLYVIDELPGWHDAYDTKVGTAILRSMLERDRNHPSILLWANGNEGGWNPALEPLFAQLDLQQRPVLRPDSLHGDFETRHYPNWQDLEGLLTPESPRNRFLRPLKAPPLILITEMLHGLYDGGGAASLEQYWERLSASPRFAGGFLWALLDEGVLRIDRPVTLAADGSFQHAIDTAGNYAPDGILGPFREPSASSRGVAQIFNQPRFQVPAMRQPPEPDVGLADSPIAPQLSFSRSTNEFLAGSFEMTQPGELGKGTVTLAHRGSPEVVVILSRGNPAAPGIASLHIQGHTLPLARGRWQTSVTQDIQRAFLVGERFEQHLVEAPHGSQGRSAGPAISTLGQHRIWPRETDQDPPIKVFGHFVRYTQTFANPDHSIRWTLDPEGLQVAVLFELTKEHDWAGLQFDLPAASIQSWVWQGLGPDRVWRNRMTGTEGLWRAEFPAAGPQQGIAVRSVGTGKRFTLLAFGGIYQTSESHLSLRTEVPGTSLSLRLGPGTIGLLAAAFPDHSEQATAATLPGLTFYSRAPAIGTKFHSGHSLQPLPRTSTQILNLRFGFQSPR